MESKWIMSDGFWENRSCHVPGGGLAYIDCGGGSVVFPTSGSTGHPKWITHRKDAILHSARAVNDWLGVDAVSVWGLALPMIHVGGFGVVARAYAAGCGLTEFEGKWDAVRFARWIASEGVTHTSLVPTQVHDLLVAGLKGSPKLRAVVVGGGRLSVESGQAAREAGWPVLASYGMTETCSQVATQRIDGLDKPFADSPMEILPIWEVMVTPDDLLCVKGDALFCGAVESGTYHPREGEWFTTSDRVAISGRNITPLGRADSMVKVMGELVDVDEVERCFIELCSRRELWRGVAILALPDSRREHELVAVFEGEVVPGMVETYNSQASGPERITRTCVVADLPRSPMGKLMRAKLAEMIVDQK